MAHRGSLFSLTRSPALSPIHTAPYRAVVRQSSSVVSIKDLPYEDEAEEYFSFNVIGAWMGRRTPVFIDRA